MSLGNLNFLSAALPHAPSALDERRLEAVYLSFAMFGQWNADKLKALPTGAECKGLHLRGFFNLCREVEILSVASTGDVGKLAPQDATNIFMDLADPVGWPRLADIVRTVFDLLYMLVVSTT